jgi:hypothetical protein
MTMCIGRREKRTGLIIVDVVRAGFAKNAASHPRGGFREYFCRASGEEVRQLMTHLGSGA